ncbi:hypothetical protein GGR58DRAFT_287374 [Xylaria digitata]|nr:hypothetical protein GGR58DRAFT_287374 [Xylaria digitata]
MAANSKPSATEAPSPNEEKIAITLSTRGPSSIPQRQLVLTRSLSVIPIGRSSKVRSKGFVPADDNAWFENPVMSRHHAELVAKFDDKPPAVYIKDVQSFHGTFHTANNGHNNEKRVSPGELVKLTNGDTVRFGVDIFRSNQTYPPCTIEFRMTQAMQKSDNLPPRRGFVVPDDVDDEEEENRENEGDSIDTVPHTKATPNNPEPKGTVTINSRGPPLIDLTVDGDELLPRNKFFISSATISNCNASSDVIDLTSEPNCESDVELCTGNPGAARSSKLTLGSPALMPIKDAPKLPRSLNLSQTSGGRLIIPPSLSVPSDDEEMWHQYHDDDDLSGEDVESLFSGDPESELDTSSPSTDGHSDLDQSDGDESSNHDETLSEVYGYGEDRRFAYLSEEINDNPIYYSDSDISSIDSIDEDEDEDDDDDEDDEKEEEREEETTTKLSNAQPRTETPTPLSTGFHQPNQCQAVTTTMSCNSISLVPPSLIRDPSPSDAALFKRHTLFDTLPNNSRAQQLGEKTGKFEFFAAREKNRAALSQHHSVEPVAAIAKPYTAISQTHTDTAETLLDDVNDPDHIRCSFSVATSDTSRSPSPTLSSPRETTAISQEVNDDVAQRPSEAPDATSIKLVDNADQYSAWAVSGDRFINNPTEEPLESDIVRSQPLVDFDMTSAYKFQQSKLATAAQNVSNIRRLPIKDLLAGEPKQSSVINKPAAEDSEVPAPKMVRHEITENDRRVLPIPAPTPTKRSHEEAFDTTATQNKSTACEATAVEGQEIRAAIPTQPESPRPTKKIRLATVAVKVAACVALGGAATFSYLVNTAPVF